jgi:hypothetical protein
MGGAEPGWWPRPAPCGVEARPRSAEDGRELILGPPLDQAAQFLALDAHGISVRTHPQPRGLVLKAARDDSLRLFVSLAINKRQDESR